MENRRQKAYNDGVTTEQPTCTRAHQASIFATSSSVYHLGSCCPMQPIKNGATTADPRRAEGRAYINVLEIEIAPSRPLFIHHLARHICRLVSSLFHPNCAIHFVTLFKSAKLHRLQLPCVVTTMPGGARMMLAMIIIVIISPYLCLPSPSSNV